MGWGRGAAVRADEEWWLTRLWGANEEGGERFGQEVPARDIKDSLHNNVGARDSRVQGTGEDRARGGRGGLRVGIASARLEVALRAACGYANGGGAAAQGIVGRGGGAMERC